MQTDNPVISGIKYLKGCLFEVLNLSHLPELTNKAIHSLNKSALRTLDLSWLNLTDRGLRSLKSSKLESLRLNWCQEITDHGLTHLKDLPLKTLSLTHCDKVTEKGRAHFPFLGVPKQ